MTKITWLFVPTPIEVKKSPAWRVMSIYAKRIIDALEIEWSKSMGKENGRLVLTYKDLMVYCGSANKRGISAAIAELVALGLITYTPGHGGSKPEPNMYGLAYFPGGGDNGGPAPDFWREITTIEEAKARQDMAKKNRGQSDWFKGKQLAGAGIHGVHRVM
jgi:hypothetical protein